MLYTPEYAERALEIVERLCLLVSPQAEYHELIAILRKSNKWQEAHAAFERIRVNLTLPWIKDERHDLDMLFVYVAENAAKTAYNCSGCPAPFDDDSFESLLKCERQFNDKYAAVKGQQSAQSDRP